MPVIRSEAELAFLAHSQPKLLTESDPHALHKLLWEAESKLPKQRRRTKHAVYLSTVTHNARYHTKTKPDMRRALERYTTAQQAQEAMQSELGHRADTKQQKKSRYANTRRLVRWYPIEWEALAIAISTDKVIGKTPLTDVAGAELARAVMRAQKLVLPPERHRHFKALQTAVGQGLPDSLRIAKERIAKALPERIAEIKAQAMTGNPRANVTAPQAQSKAQRPLMHEVMYPPKDDAPAARVHKVSKSQMKRIAAMKGEPYPAPLPAQQPAQPAAPAPSLGLGALAQVAELGGMWGMARKALIALGHDFGTAIGMGLRQSAQGALSGVLTGTVTVQQKTVETTATADLQTQVNAIANVVRNAVIDVVGAPAAPSAPPPEPEPEPAKTAAQEREETLEEKQRGPRVDVVGLNNENASIVHKQWGQQFRLRFLTADHAKRKEVSAPLAIICKDFVSHSAVESINQNRTKLVRINGAAGAVCRHLEKLFNEAQLAAMGTTNQGAMALQHH